MSWRSTVGSSSCLSQQLGKLSHYLSTRNILPFLQAWGLLNGHHSCQSPEVGPRDSKISEPELCVLLLQGCKSLSEASVVTLINIDATVAASNAAMKSWKSIKSWIWTILRGKASWLGHWGQLFHPIPSTDWCYKLLVRQKSTGTWHLEYEL